MRIVTKAVWRLLNNRHLLHFVNSLKISPSWNVHSKRTQYLARRKLKKKQNKTKERSNLFKSPPTTKQNAQVPVRCAKYAWSTVSVHSQKTKRSVVWKQRGLHKWLWKRRRASWESRLSGWACQNFDIHILTLKLQMQDDKYNNIRREKPCSAWAFKKKMSMKNINLINSLCQRNVCFVTGGLVIKEPESAVC